MDQIIVQPASLNRLVDRTIPWTWAARWEALAPVVPFILVMALLRAETLVLDLWVHERLNVAVWWNFGMLFFGIGGICLLGNEAAVRCSHWLKRSLRFSEKGITRESSKRVLVRWPRVSSLRIEPLEGEAGLKKLTLEYWSGKPGRGSPLRWSMVVQHPAQTESLREQLNRFQPAGQRKILLEELPQALLATPKRKVRGLGWMVAALLLAVHAFPLIMAGISKTFISGGTMQAPAGHSPAAPKLTSWAEPLLGDPGQLRWLCLAAGVCLMTAAILCYIKSWRNFGKAAAK